MSHEMSQSQEHICVPVFVSIPWKAQLEEPLNGNESGSSVLFGWLAWTVDEVTIQLRIFFPSLYPPNFLNDCYSCLIICLVSLWQMLGALTAIPIKVPQISSLQRLAGHSPSVLPQVIHNIRKTLKPVFMKPYYFQIIFIGTDTASVDNPL